MVRKNDGGKRLEKQCGRRFAGGGVIYGEVKILMIKRSNFAIVLEGIWGDYCSN